jgi:hypothetical protein
MHVHVGNQDGEAKFWLEPEVELARTYRLSGVQLREVEGIVVRLQDEFRAAWTRHFGR